MVLRCNLVTENPTIRFLQPFFLGMQEAKMNMPVVDALCTAGASLIKGLELGGTFFADR